MSKMFMKTQLSGKLTMKCIGFPSFSLIWGVQSKGVPFDQLCNPRVLPLAGLGNPSRDREMQKQRVPFDIDDETEHTRPINMKGAWTTEIWA